jgi:iron complex outermembrane recepter protein
MALYGSLHSAARAANHGQRQAFALAFRLAVAALVATPAAMAQSQTAADAADAANAEEPRSVVPRTVASAAAEPQQIVVTGTKRLQAQQQATQSVSVLRPQDTIGLQSGFDVFTRMPNVVQQTDTFLPTVRGLDGNGVAAGGGGAVTGANPRMSNYVDGVARTYGATPDGQGGFWDMAQVEIYRGAQSTQLGQNSIAGAIVQTTQNPKFKDEVAVQLGAHNRRATFNGALMLNKVFGDQLAVRFTAEGLDGKSAIDYSGMTATGLTAADRDELGRTQYGRVRFKALYAPTEQLALKLTVEQERRKNAYTPDGASNSSRRELSNAVYGTLDYDNKIVALNANHELSPEWLFDAVLSQQKATTQFGPPKVGTPNPAGFLNFSFQSDEIALEPKLVYKARQGRTGAVLGAFVKTRQRDDLGRPGSLFELAADDRAKSASVYADATVQLSAAWDLLAAARFQNDRQKRNFSAFDGSLGFGFDERNRVFLPKLGATFHASRDASVSVSFVTFTPYRYQKETAKTVELVARTQWLDRQLTANANLFFTQLKDAQTSGVGPAGPDDAIYVNLAKAQTKGLEFDLVYQPKPGQRLQFALGLLDTKIVNFGSVANNSNNGKQLALSPHVTANLGGSFEVLPQLTVGADVAFVGRRFSDYQNTPEDQLASYSVSNMNAQYRLGSVTITGYVNNLFDRLVQTSRTTANDSAYVNDPRTVGVNLKVEF